MTNVSKFETNVSVFKQKHQFSSDFKVTVLGLTPSDWDVATLEALSEKIMVGIASAATHAYRDRGVPFLRNQNILPNKLDVSDILYVSPEYEVAFQNKRLKAGDLLTARTGYPGTTCMIPDAFEGAQSFTTLITRLKTDRVLPEFVCAFMNSEQGQKFFELNQIGGGQKNVNSSILKTFPLPIPQLPEQTAIANALSDVDALIQELEKLIAKKQAIKTATMQQLLTGRTRLPQFAHHPDGRKKGYKPSELGEIPEDWEVKEANTFSAFITKGSTPTTYGFDWEKDGVIFLRSECVSEIGLDLSESMFISEKANQVLNRSEVRSGDILVTITGNVGRAVFLDEKIERANINQHIARIRVCDPEVIAHYVYHFLSQAEVRRELNKITTGQAYPQLSLEQVRNIKVLLPSCAEQMIIASLLTEMDSEIQTLKRRLNKTRQIKQGMMQELLTGKTRLV